jgi:hypothetical protein
MWWLRKYTFEYNIWAWLRMWVRKYIFYTLANSEQGEFRRQRSCQTILHHFGWSDFVKGTSDSYTLVRTHKKTLIFNFWQNSLTFRKLRITLQQMLAVSAAVRKLYWYSCLRITNLQSIMLIMFILFVPYIDFLIFFRESHFYVVVPRKFMYSSKPVLSICYELSVFIFYTSATNADSLQFLILIYACTLLEVHIPTHHI